MDLDGRQMLPLKDTITSYTFSVYLMPSAFLFSFSQISACRHLICSLFVCCLCFRGSDACDSQRPSSCCFFSESMTTDRHTLVLEPNALAGFPTALLQAPHSVSEEISWSLRTALRAYEASNSPDVTRGSITVRSSLETGRWCFLWVNGFDDPMFPCTIQTDQI